MQIIFLLNKYLCSNTEFKPCTLFVSEHAVGIQSVLMFGVSNSASRVKTCVNSFVLTTEKREQPLPRLTRRSLSFHSLPASPPTSYSSPLQTFEKLLWFLSHHLKHSPSSPFSSSLRSPDSFVPSPPSLES